MSRITYPTKCTKCYKEIFYHKDEYGGRVFFEDLGGGWEKHECDPDYSRNYTENAVMEVCENKECGMDILVMKTRAGDILRCDVFDKNPPHDCNLDGTGKSKRRLKSFLKRKRKTVTKSL